MKAFNRIIKLHSNNYAYAGDYAKSELTIALRNFLDEYLDQVRSPFRNKELPFPVHKFLGISTVSECVADEVWKYAKKYLTNPDIITKLDTLSFEVKVTIPDDAATSESSTIKLSIAMYSSADSRINSTLEGDIDVHWISTEYMQYMVKETGVEYYTDYNVKAADAREGSIVCTVKDNIFTYEDKKANKKKIIVFQAYEEKPFTEHILIFDKLATEGFKYASTHA